MSESARRGNEPRRKFKGRGNSESMDVEVSERYSGKGSIFDRLDRDTKDGPVKSVEGWIVFVRGIHEEATEEDVTENFSKFGPLKNLQMPLDRRTGYVKGYALVEYEVRSEAENAISQTNNSIFLEKPISVDWAFSRGK